jgi:hypothetical protein
MTTLNLQIGALRRWNLLSTALVALSGSFVALFDDPVDVYARRRTSTEKVEEHALVARDTFRPGDWSRSTSTEIGHGRTEVHLKEEERSREEALEQANTLVEDEEVKKVALDAQDEEYPGGAPFARVLLSENWPVKNISEFLFKEGVSALDSTSKLVRREDRVVPGRAPDNEGVRDLADYEKPGYFESAILSRPPDAPLELEAKFQPFVELFKYFRKLTPDGTYNWERVGVWRKEEAERWIECGLKLKPPKLMPKSDFDAAISGSVPESDFEGMRSIARTAELALAHIFAVEISKHDVAQGPICWFTVSQKSEVHKVNGCLGGQMDLNVDLRSLQSEKNPKGSWIPFRLNVEVCFATTG